MTLHFATSNQGKLREARAKLAPVPVERLVMPYPEIQAFTLEEVVAFGLEWVRERSDKDVMIEDSGLFIEGLKGLPGVYSAYVYKWVGCAGILKLMDGVENRQAEFRSCIGLLLDGESRILSGSCAGAISEEARGAGGFGFDPIFVPRGSKRTFAEMSLEEKNALSHRARALDKVARLLAERKGA